MNFKTDVPITRLYRSPNSNFPPVEHDKKNEASKLSGICRLSNWNMAERNWNSIFYASAYEQNQIMPDDYNLSALYSN